MNPISLFLLVLRSSLLSTGGFGNVPALHTDLVGGGVASEATFAEALAVGQISPGPNGLWVVSLGYLVSGWWGALSATLAVTLPPLLVLVIEKLYRRVSDHPAVEGLMRGLSLAVVGIFLVVMARLIGTFQTDEGAMVATAVALAFGLSRRVPVIWIIVLFGAAGILVGSRR